MRLEAQFRAPWTITLLPVPAFPRGKSIPGAVGCAQQNETELTAKPRDGRLPRVRLDRVVRPDGHGQNPHRRSSPSCGLMHCMQTASLFNQFVGAGVALLGRLALTVAQNLGIAAERIHDDGRDEFDTR